MEKELNHENDAEKFVPIELYTLEELTEFWLTAWNNNGYLPQKDTHKNRKDAEWQAKKTLKEISKEQDPMHVYGIKESGHLVATGRLSFSKDARGMKIGHLAGLTVNEEYRGQSLAKKITDIRIEKAKEAGCAYISTEVFASNAIGLVTKLNDGFVITGPKTTDGELIAFILTKKIDRDPDHDQKDSVGQLEEINFTNQDKIIALLQSGWYGIDMKNLGDANDNDPARWVMILEKK